MNEPIYLRLVRAFFVATEVDNNNFTLKATLKGTKILILEQLLVDLLGVAVEVKDFMMIGSRIKGSKRRRFIGSFQRIKGRLQV